MGQMTDAQNDILLVAEFMGGREYIHKKHFPNLMQIEAELLDGNDLEFNKSWDWIMPVLEKVCNDGEYWFEITINGCRIGKRNEETAFIDNCSGMYPPSSCTAVFISIVELIKSLSVGKK